MLTTAPVVFSARCRPFPNQTPPRAALPPCILLRARAAAALSTRLMMTFHLPTTPTPPLPAAQTTTTHASNDETMAPPKTIREKIQTFVASDKLKAYSWMKACASPLLSEHSKANVKKAFNELCNEDGTIFHKVDGSNVLFHVSAQDRNALKKQWADHIYDPESGEPPKTDYAKPKKTIKKKPAKKEPAKDPEVEDVPEGEDEGEEGADVADEVSAVATPH